MFDVFELKSRAAGHKSARYDLHPGNRSKHDVKIDMD